jgi:hypothetical protein
MSGICEDVFPSDTSKANKDRQQGGSLVNRIASKLRIALASVLALALILSVAALAGPGKGKKPAKVANASAKAYGKNRVAICHKGKTIRVALPAVKAHQRHGDTVGPCP